MSTCVSVLAEAAAPPLRLFVNRLNGKHKPGFLMKVTNWRLWIETKEIVLEIASGNQPSASDVQSISAQQNLVTPMLAQGVKMQNE